MKIEDYKFTSADLDVMRIVIKIINDRDSLHKAMEDSYDEDSDTYKVDHQEQIDTMSESVHDLLKKTVESLPVEFTIEALTHLGAAPNLMYDDNGNFAISECGIQPVMADDELLEGAMTTIMEAAQWSPTIRGAMVKYFEED